MGEARKDGRGEIETGDARKDGRREGQWRMAQLSHLSRVSRLYLASPISPRLSPLLPPTKPYPSQRCPTYARSLPRPVNHDRPPRRLPCPARHSSRDGRGDPLARARHRREHGHVLHRRRAGASIAPRAKRRPPGAAHGVAPPREQRVEQSRLGVDSRPAHAVRRRVRVLRRALQPRAGRRDRSCRWPLGQRPDVRSARCGSRRGPTVHARRRPSRRRARRLRRRDQLRILATQVRRRTGRYRPHRHAQPDPVHRRRRHPARFLRSRGRPPIRDRRAARH